MREGREFDEIPPMRPPNGVYLAQGLRLDTQTGQLWRDGEPVHLRPKTFLLFQYLVENHHRLVPKDELFAEIWKDANVTDSTLVGCIQEIRKALDDDVRTPRFIKTVPKRGYQFIAGLENAGEDAAAVPGAVAVPAQAVRRRGRIWAGVAAAGVLMAGVWMAERRSPAAKEPPRLEVARWRMDGGDVTGVQGKAVRFDGLRTVLEGVDEERVLPVGGSARTMLVWIRTSTTNGDSTVIFNYNSAPRLSDSNDSFRLSLRQDGRVTWGRHGWAGQAGRKDLAVSLRRVDDGQWHLVAGSYAGNPGDRGTLYVDGVEEGAAAMPLERTEQAGPETRWALGNGVHRGTFFRGDIDDARVYAYALRPAMIAALYRCGAGTVDVEAPGLGRYYLMALASPAAHDSVRLEIGPGGAVRNTGLDYAGVQLGKRVGDCGMAEMRAADLGQDLYQSVELKTPVGPLGEETQAGPFFRSRRAAPGDGIQGGSSAGFWVRLHSTGSVTVRRLNPMSTVAFTQAVEGFDGGRFHRLEVAVKGNAMEAALDGEWLIFEQGGQRGRNVRLDAAWEGNPPLGENRGSVGIYFGAEANRNRVGGQEARNWQVLPYRAIAANPPAISRKAPGRERYRRRP